MEYKKWLPYTGWLVAAILAIALFNAKYTIQEKTPSITTQQTTEKPTHQNTTKTQNYPKSTARNKTNENNQIPTYVLEVLDYVRQNHQAMEGYVGGRKFMNREKQLPKTDNQGPINYQEWDVHPKRSGQNRGAERLVTGSNNTAYYTANHYQSFTPIP